MTMLLLQVIVLAFWGRRRTVRILQPYIHRNMQRNGGVIDQVSAPLPPSFPSLLLLNDLGQVMIMQRRDMTEGKDKTFLAGLLRDFPQDYSLVEPELATSSGAHLQASLFLRVTEG